MPIVKVLGSGCENCKRLAWLAERTASHLGIEVQVIKVTNYNEIMKCEILSMPGLTVNEQLVSAGRILSEAEITTFLATALETA